MRMLTIKISRKKLRIGFGILMMECFLALAFTINFFSQAAVGTSKPLLAFFLMLSMFWFLWTPTILCIILLYIFLTKVYPYEEPTKC